MSVLLLTGSEAIQQLNQKTAYNFQEMNDCVICWSSWLAPFQFAKLCLGISPIGIPAQLGIHLIPTSTITHKASRYCLH